MQDDRFTEEVTQHVIAVDHAVEESAASTDDFRERTDADRFDIGDVAVRSGRVESPDRAEHPPLEHGKRERVAARLRLDANGAHAIAISTCSNASSPHVSHPSRLRRAKSSR